MRNQKRFPVNNEDGIVALFVVGIMIILLSLITVAFTKLMGREARQALDRQLSTQAYYAAASGINDARDYLNTHPGALLTTNDCNTLATQGYPPFLGPNNTDVNKVTCVVGDTTPEQLYFQIPAGKSKIFEISTDRFIGGILFSWDNANAADRTTYNPANYKTPATAKGFSNVTGWNGASTTVAPVLEVTYYPMPDNPQDMPNTLLRGRTIYLYPAGPRSFRTASTYNSTEPDGSIITSSCQNGTSLQAPIFNGVTTDGSVNHCNTVVNPLISPSGPGSQSAPKNVFVKVSAFYGTAALIVRAEDNSGEVHNPIPIKNAQVVLDATGKGGSDVLKRLQTIVDLRPNDVEPGDTIETVMGLCKRLEYNLTLQTPQVNDPSPDADTSPACAIN